MSNGRGRDDASRHGSNHVRVCVGRRWRHGCLVGWTLWYHEKLKKGEEKDLREATYKGLLHALYIYSAMCRCLGITIKEN